MVNGLDRFRTHFAAYSDRYVLIGGTASSLAMEELGERFRATKDLDIVLCVEALDREFAQAFWDFIKLGDYENRQKSTGKRLFYRFYGPRQAGFPEMLELFARIPDALDLSDGAQLTPIPVDDAVSSLSAIIMDEDYYAFVMDRRTEIDGLAVLKADALIPLKAHAFVDLSERKAAGEAIDSKSIKKHKNDIFRLFTVLARDGTIPMGEKLRRDLSNALDRIGQELIDLKPFGITDLKMTDVIDELRRLYGLNAASTQPTEEPR
jgi:hypothetical protein